MGKSSPKAPPAPDPVVTSQAQTASNKETAIANAALNRVNQYTPYGSLTYTKTGEEDGVPIYRSDVRLTPEAQALLNQQMQQDKQVGDIAGGYMNRIQNVMGQGMDFSKLPQLQTSVGPSDFSADRAKVEEAFYSRMNPQFERDQQALDARLANQGIMQGSEAWKEEQDVLQRAKNDARVQAVLAGGDEQSRLFGLGLQQGQFANQARSQALSDALTERQLPLNEFNALRSATQLQTPQFGNVPNANVAGTDVSGNIWQNYNAQQNAYNQKAASRNSLTNSLVNAGASIGTALLLSDRRLKKNIKKIGKTKKGINVYRFEYLGSSVPQIGVMAQEVEKIIPEAVVRDAAGFRMVDYALVG